MATPTIYETFDQIKVWLGQDENTRLVLQSFNEPATDEEIADAESQLGVSFPDELRAAYRILNGQDEDRVPLASEGLIEVGLLPSFDADDLAHLFLSLEQVVEMTPTADAEGMPGWVPGWITIGSNLGGDSVVIARDGRVLQFFHEYAGAVEVAPTFGDYLRGIAGSMESGKVFFDEDCGLSREDTIDPDEETLESSLSES